jgi:hypothetical protein
MATGGGLPPAFPLTAVMPLSLMRKPLPSASTQAMPAVADEHVNGGTDDVCP